MLALFLLATAVSASLPTIGGPPQCASTTQPYLLRADSKLSPSLGTSLRPTFAWALPAVNATSVQVQVFSAGTGALLYDSGSLPPAWALTYPDSAPALWEGAPFLWCVGVTASASGATVAWSLNASLVTMLSPAGWAAGIQPVWHANSSAQLAFVRGKLRLPSGRGRVAAAYAFVTAQPQRSLRDSENGKLLGAYRLYVEGALAGLGPGRPGVCGPVYPGPMPGTPPCSPYFGYDVLDITAAVALAQSAAGGSATLALQCFNAPGPDPSHVQLQVSVHFEGEDGRQPFVFGTDPQSSDWSVWDATAFMAPSCCTETQWFYGPQEHWDLRLEPVGWRTLGFDSSSWQALAPASAFPGQLAAKPTLSLQVVQGLQPVTSHALSPTHTVYDFGREFQGGLVLTFPASTPAGARFAVQQGEELAEDGSVMYLMRTLNNYTATVTTRAGAAVSEQHEYTEFRYAQVVQLDVGGDGPTCAASAWGDYTTPLTLACPQPSSTITAFSFASFGAPSGSCTPAAGGSANTFAANATCSAAATLSILNSHCLGRQGCTLTPSDAVFNAGLDPCHLTPKRLAAAWSCSAPSAPPSPPLPPPAVTAWQVFYPASFAADAADSCPGGAAGTGEAGGSLSGLGQFSSSSPALDAIFALCEYTVRATNLDLVTDSNTRQRSPVCAEAAVATSLNQGAASYESASQAFLTEYMLNMSPPPKGAGWAEWQALLISSVALLHQATGDLALYTAHAPLLRAYLERELFGNASAGGGLWACSPSDPWACKQPEVDWPSGMRDGFQFVPANTVVNAHYVGALQEWAGLAEAAGDSAGAGAARANASALAAAMQASLWSAGAGAFVDGLGASHAAIHSTVYAVGRGVQALAGSAPGAQQAAWRTLLSRLLNASSIPVGPYPGMWYGEALFSNTSDHGMAGVGLFLLANGTNSWLNQLRQGATTTMEAWTPAEKPNLTWSHPWMAFPLQLIMRWLLGVRAAAPGFGSVLIQPQPGPLSHAQGVVPTLRGPVAVALAQALGPGAWFAVNVSIPGGVQGRVCLPGPACGAGARVVVDGGVVQGEQQGDYACVAVGEGAHQLACPA